MPADGDDAARAFYGGVLGMIEVPKPAELAKRGGCWFESGQVQVHLGVETDFRPAKKAHPALRCSDYNDLVQRLRRASVEVHEPNDIPGVRRCHIHDPYRKSHRADRLKSTAMLVLASASPRRQELLRNAGIEFVVQPAHIPEIPREGEYPKIYAERLAREKAQAVFRQRPQDVVLGADTVVVVDQQILEKPCDAEDAARMLRMLSAREHVVITGVCLVGTGFEDLRSETTKVIMDTISDTDIANYVATNEPMDKAGAYAIQGMASRWIPRIEGDYSNVVGLPVALVYRMLREDNVLG